jgi:hypothetical protein
VAQTVEDRRSFAVRPRHVFDRLYGQRDAHVGHVQRVQDEFLAAHSLLPCPVHVGLVISLVGPQKSRAATTFFLSSSQFRCGTRPITSSLMLCRRATTIRGGCQVQCSMSLLGHLSVLGIGGSTFDPWLRAPVDKYLSGPTEMQNLKKLAYNASVFLG